jgi:hypothetical protein
VKEEKIRSAGRESLWLGLRQIVEKAAFFPLTTSLEDFDALAALQDAALGTNGGGGAETAVLGHKVERGYG